MLEWTPVSGQKLYGTWQHGANLQLFTTDARRCVGSSVA